MKHHSRKNFSAIDNKIDCANVDGSKSSCVAWFKLADLISRKEKEKALNLYRLISHSFDDKAYALQVEADILWSLEDNAALEKYTQAAYLYKKEKKLLSSAAVYEHLLTLEPENIDYLKSLILLYVFVSWQEKFEKNYLKLFELARKKILEQDDFFNFSKKVINFYVNTNKMDTDKFKEEYEIELEEASDLSWLLSSIKNVLKKNKEFFNFIKQYCLDNQLNFDS